MSWWPAYVPQPIPYSPDTVLDLYPAPSPDYLPRGINSHYFDTDMNQARYQSRTPVASFLEVTRKRYNPIPESDKGHLQIVLGRTYGTGCRFNQIFSATDPLRPNERFVLKIFDPVYAQRPDGSTNYFESIKRAVGREVAAYSRIDPVLQGAHVPRYYGCWSCRVPGQDRFVHAVLIQEIIGDTVASLRPEDFAPDVRIDIIRQASTVWLDILKQRVRTNLILKDILVTRDAVPTVFLVDYARCDVFDGPDELFDEYLEGHRTAPILHGDDHNRSVLNSFVAAGWIGVGDVPLPPPTPIPENYRKMVQNSENNRLRQPDKKWLART